MIQVTYSPITYEVVMDGHADYAPMGSDIVCAGASILFFSLIRTLECHSDHVLGSIRTRKDGDRVFVQAIPQEGYTREFEAVYEVFTNGIRLLHENYPNNVNFCIRGECAH